MLKLPGNFGNVVVRLHNILIFIIYFCGNIYLLYLYFWDYHLEIEDIYKLILLLSTCLKICIKEYVQIK